MPSVELLVLLSAVAFLLGFLAVALYVSWQQARQLRTGVAPSWPYTGCSQVSLLVLQSPQKAKLDMRLSGAGNIDEQLQKVLGYGLRDYVESWYSQVSPDPRMLKHIRHALHTAIIRVAGRSKEVDLLGYFTQTMVEDCIGHFRLYKIALKEGEGEGGEGMERAFFSGEPQDDPWAAVCLNTDAKQVYFQRLTELLLCLLLPEEDFRNTALLQFVRDMMVWQVWLPLLSLLSQPDYLNSTILSLFKDSTLSVESFTAAMAECNNSDHLTELHTCLQAEISRLQKRGTTDADQQRLSALESLLSSVSQQEGAEEAPEPDASAVLLSLSTAIPQYSVKQEGGDKHAVYHIEVECQHQQVPVVERWTTLRRYSDFHDLHLTLRNLLGSLPPTLTLPSQRSFHKLGPQLLEVRRAGLQEYLQVVSSSQFLTAHPQALSPLVLFLSGRMYQHSHNELARRVDSFVQPFRPSRRSTTIRAPETSKSPSPTPVHRPQTEEGRPANEEDEFSLPVHLLLLVLGEVFGLQDEGGWLRRQLSLLLKQLWGERVNRRTVEAIDSLIAPEQIADYISDLSHTLWPGGYPASPHPPADGRIQARRALLARAKLIGSIPDDLRRFIGAERTAKGMARVFDLLQSKPLNQRLLLALLEGLLDSLFPSRKLRPTLRKLRSELPSPLHE